MHWEWQAFARSLKQECAFWRFSLLMHIHIACGQKYNPPHQTRRAIRALPHTLQTSRGYASPPPPVSQHFYSYLFIYIFPTEGRFVLLRRNSNSTAVCNIDATDTKIYIVQYSKDSIISDIFVHYFLCHGPHHSSLDLTLKTLALQGFTGQSHTRS